MAPPSGYILVWSDEFNGTSLDASKWTAPERGFLSPRRLKVENGMLVITSTFDSYGRSGGEISSGGKYDFTYGYVEVRAKAASQHGNTFGVWLSGRNLKTDGTYTCLYETNIEYGPTKPELHYTVICDPSNDSTNPGCTTSGWGNCCWDGSQWGGGCPTTPRKANGITYIQSIHDNFHVHGIEWTSTYIRFLLDGVEKRRVTTGIRKNSMHIIIWCCPNCWPEASITQQYPATMYVDYVRVYKKGIVTCDTPVLVMSIN